MKTRYLLTFLLVGLFAAGIPVGVLANEFDGEGVFIHGPLDTGALESPVDEISKPSDRPRSMEEAHEVDHGVFRYRAGIDDGP